MRRSLFFSVVVGAAVTLAGGVLETFQEHAVHADVARGQGGGGVSQNGDVNGDGARDLSDAIYLLAHLFQGGDAPLPCPGDGGGAGGGNPSGSPLPPTGQTLCYDENGDTTDCMTGDCLGQDGGYVTQGVGCAANPRFVDNLDGTITDNCTNLMWQQDTADTSGDGAMTPSECNDGAGQPNDVCCTSVTFTLDVVGDDIPWSEALDYCENLSFANHNDWRLPNIQELQSIVDYSRQDPAIDTTLFSAASPSPPGLEPACRPYYWSSTSMEEAPTGQQNNGAPYAYHVDFSIGFVSYHYKDPHNIRLYVRAVRSVPAAGAGAELLGDPGQGAGVAGNGDANGDLALDLSDAIYLLAFLFQGGPAPEPCVDQPEADCGNMVDDDNDGDTDCADSDCTGNMSCPETETICDDNVDNDFDGETDCADSDCTATHPEDPSLLPDTGQTSCFTSTGRYRDCIESTCTGTAPPGQDGFYKTGCASDGTRFTDNGDGTVTDNCTGLMWQQDTANTNGIGGIDDDDTLLWCAALTYCEGTLNAGGGFAGKTGWRLPNIREIQSIADYSGLQTRGTYPAFGEQSTHSDGSSWYWSSTSRADAPSQAWRVKFTGAPSVSLTSKVTATAPPNPTFVRAVRNAP